MRLVAVAASVLCLAGCFVFDNPFDTSSTPTVTFQIVITSALYGGTYVWNPTDNAFEATIAGSRYYVSEPSGTWRLTGPNDMNLPIASGTYSYGALPPMTIAGWSPYGKVSAVNDEAGGISAGSSPDAAVSQALSQVLQVSFLASSPATRATYQWERGSPPSSFLPVNGETASTYALKPGDVTHWLRVVVTPTDSTGVVVGTPVASPSVYVSN